MIRNFRARVMTDPRGKIKTGQKNERGLPQSLDYFKIDAFPELLEAYGPRPTFFTIKFPSDEPIDFFDTWFERWGGRKSDSSEGTLIRRCDGETCLHRINESIGGKSYGAGEESPCVCQSLDEKDKQRCSYILRLKAWIVLPQTGKIENPLCYRFESGSHNSGDSIMSALNDVRILTGGTLRGIPFSLSVKMVSGKEDAKLKFPIWSLIPIGTVTQMREHSRQLTGESVPLLSKAPQALEDPVVKSSRILLERYQPVIGNVATVGELSRLRKEIETAVSEGNLIQSDYDKLLDAMKSKYEAIKK